MGDPKDQAKGFGVEVPKQDIVGLVFR